MADSEKNIYSGVLSGNMLKLLACASMLIDHIGLILFPGVTALRAVGRLAMPLFAFTFAEGCFYTRSKWKHFLLVLAIGLITSAGFSVAEGRLTGDIMITLSLSCLIIYSLDGLKRSAFERRGKKTALCAAALAASVVFAVWLCCFSGADIDYGIAGVLLPVTVRLLDFGSCGAKGMLASLYSVAAMLLPFAIDLLILSALYGIVQFYCLLSLFPILLYSGRRGKARLKYFFYVFYPAHLALLAGIWLILNPGSLASFF